MMIALLTLMLLAAAFYGFVTLLNGCRSKILLVNWR